MARSTVVINGKLFDVASGKQLDCSIQKKPLPRTNKAKNAGRRPKTATAASRATYQKPVFIAKPEHNVASGAVPTAAIAPNPVIVARPEPKAKPTPPAKKPRRKLLLGLLATIIVVIIGGILAALYMPSFSVKLALTQAGIDGKYPAYTVEGYGLDGTVQSEPGGILMNFRNSTNGQTYSISERSSNWDTNGLLENKVKLDSNDYETLTQKGLTIFKYDGVTTWVNGGIIYAITNNSNLDIDQILRIIDGI